MSCVVIALLKSFLCERNLTVKVTDVLEPLLFLLCTDIFRENFRCHYKLYADDVKIYRCIAEPKFDYIVLC